MGKSVQNITGNVSLIASEETWIEGLAIEQLIKTSELEGMVQVAGMPDLHPGRGYPIGAAFFSSGKIYPALVGNDIGCGMALWQTSAKVGKANIERWVKKLEDVEQPLDGGWLDEIALRKSEKGILCADYDYALGTIGGGNHFAEFQAVETIYDADEVGRLGIDKTRLLLLVHSGSRGLGQAVLSQHISQFNHDGLAEGNPELARYIRAHDEAVKWAELNREMIAQRFLQAVRESGERVLDINHNLVVGKSIDNIKGWLHRKGATPADQGCVVIPGSRGDFSYLVAPLSTSDVSDDKGCLSQSLYSLAHGAGRKWKRGDCQARLSHKYKREDLLRTALGSRVICGNKELLYDEAPQAYKKCESIIEDLVNAGLIRVIARLRPVLTFKTNGGCSS